MKIQFGTLLNVFGTAATHEGFVFVPADVELAGNGFATEFRLGEAVGKAVPGILLKPIQERYDAAWVRARLPQVFRFTPEFADVEKTLIYVGFVAVPQGYETGFPFICSDYYGRTGLLFSPSGPDLATRARIAAAFWSLLLQSPEDVSNFEQSVFDPGAGGWMHFGCKDGELSYEWTQEETTE